MSFDQCGNRPNRRAPSLAVFCLVSFAMVAALGTPPPARAGGPPVTFVKGLVRANTTVIDSDSRGNIYVGGYLTNAIVKFDRDGNQVASFSIPGYSRAEFWISGVLVDASDEVYFCGQALKVGSAQNVLGRFVGKLGADGSLIFLKLAQVMPFIGSSLALGPDGSIMVGGRVGERDDVFYEGFAFSGLNSISASVFKLTPDGSPIWMRRISGNAQVELQAIATTADGSVLMAGTAYSSATSVSGVTVPGFSPRSHYLFKVGPDGTSHWGKSAGSSLDPTGFYGGLGAVAFSPRDNAILWAGEFTGTLPLTTPPAISKGGNDVFVANYAANGASGQPVLRWAKPLGGSGDQFASSIKADGFGNIYVAGFFNGSISADNLAVSSAGDWDLFVAKLRADGSVAWLKRLGGPSRDITVSLEFSATGELLVAGQVTGNFSIDGEYQAVLESAEGFLVKFQAEGAPPRFASDPKSQVVSPGMSFTLAPEMASNDPAVRFQWWFEGEPLPGETNQTLTVSNSQPTHAGNYHVVAQNDGGSATSGTASISYTDATSLLLSVHPSLTIFGLTGHTYRIEYSNQPQGASQWITATNLVLTISPTVWIDPTAAVGEKRFYRVLRIP